jgi:Cu/Ag efflux protein CusF
MKRNVRPHTPLVVLTTILLFAVGCGRQQENQSGTPEHHRIKGLVMAIEPERNRIIIAHEEVPHFMKAMTMPFTFKDSSLIKGLEVGDSVLGIVARRQSEMWIDSLTVFRSARSAELHQ